MDFKDYGFKPVDVINGLNKYYSEKDSKYLHITREKHAYWHLLDKDVTDAINWLREEHNIFYTPGMKLEDPVDLDIFDNPRYKFLSILSAELGFLTIVGPCNADKTEEGILKAVKRLKEKNEEATSFKTDYANAKYARAELANLYKKILVTPELPRDLSPHEVATRISDKVKRISEAFEAECKRHNETIKKCVNLRGSLREIYENVTGKSFDTDTSPEDICNEVTEVVNKLRHDRGKYKGMLNAAYGVHSVDRSPSSIGVLSDGTLINREDFADLFGLARYSSWGQIYEKVRGVLNDNNRLRHQFKEKDDAFKAVCDEDDIFRKRALDAERKLAELRKEYSRYHLAVGSLLGIPKEARKDISAIESSFAYTKDCYEKLQEFRNDVCEIFDIPSSIEDEHILKELHDVADRYDELEDFRADICGALDIEGMLGTPQQNDKYILEQIEKLKDDSTRLDRYARLSSNICTALCLCGETSDEDILKAVEAVMEHATELQFNTVDKDEYDKLCEDYTKLRKAVWNAMNRKPETLPKETARLIGEVTELARGEKLLIEFRDAVAEAIGISYPTTNNFIATRVADIYKECGELHDLIPKLRGEAQDLQSKYYDAESRFRFQSGLRQMWHTRYESEHERANGVQKALDREREKCRVKDISLETFKKQYEKVCGNLETVECALNGMKSKVRELREEKTKAITALGQDIWDDCVK